MEKVHKKNGFTLVEILVVILVIGLLFLFFIPKIDFASSKAKETGVKSDFRSYALASEQLIRENSGLDKFISEAEIRKALNKYLDPGLEIGRRSFSTQTDPWNQPYCMQYASVYGSSNCALMIVSGGKDGERNGRDDYVTATIYVSGEISTATRGFSSNIESGAITDITGGGGIEMIITGKTVELTYGI